MIPRINLPDGETVPVMGQSVAGWRAEDPGPAVRALRAGLDLGMNLVLLGPDPSGAERALLAEALGTGRDRVFLAASLPAGTVVAAGGAGGGAGGLRGACLGLLEGLRTDRLDLLLLSHPPADGPAVSPRAAVEGLERLRDEGLIRHWGVDGFPRAAMVALAEAGGWRCAAGRVRYSLAHRAPEAGRLGWLVEQAIPALAAGPLDGGALARHPGLGRIAADFGLSAAQLALAWLVNRRGVVALPRALRVDHVRANRRALDAGLTPDAMEEIDHLFPSFAPGPLPPAGADGRALALAHRH